MMYSYRSRFVFSVLVILLSLSFAVAALNGTSSSHSEPAQRMFEDFNEAFIRLSGQRVFEWQNREQFLSLAAQIMRRVLVDHARQRAAQRRGDGARRVSLEDTQAAIEIDKAQALQALDDERVDVLAIDSALTKLSLIDAPQGRIVELRYFGGLTLEETASVAGISLATVKRELAIARAWLRRELATQDASAAT